MSPQAVTSFTGRYACLSNFYVAPVTVDGVTYRTNEHYFQAHKALFSADFRMIVAAVTAREAKQIGRSCRPLPEWDSVREGVMREGLLAKFWAHGGLNLLGQLLMEVREQIRLETAP